MNAQGQVWPHNHAPEDPLFFETLEASIRHSWVDKSRLTRFQRMHLYTAHACTRWRTLSTRSTRSAILYVRLMQLSLQCCYPVISGKQGCRVLESRWLSLPNEGHDAAVAF